MLRNYLMKCQSRRLALCCLLFIIISFTAACGDKSVATVSTENEAIEILDVLRDQGFKVDKEEIVSENETKKWSVVVDEGLFGSGDAALAIQVLVDRGLPRPEDKGMEGAYEEQGMFPSESAQKAQRLKELKTEVERQLRMLPGIVRVSVNIVLPEDNTLSLNPYPASASVVIVHKDPQPGFTGEQVQNSVAGSVPNLKAENVRVTLAQQQARPIQRRDVDVRRRNNMLLAAGIGLIIVLGCFLVVLILQTRRQRAQLAALREGGEQEEQEVAEEAESTQLPGGHQQQLDDGVNGNGAVEGATARQLPDAADQLNASEAKDVAQQPQAS